MIGEAAAALAARLGGGAFVPPAPPDRADLASPRAWVESLVAQLPPPAACAIVEHLFAVLPLAAACFPAPPGRDRAAVVDGLAAGRRLGALGFCTPTPEMGWEAAAVTGEAAGGGLRLSGTVRLAHAAAGGALLLVRQAGGGHRLAWLALDDPPGAPGSAAAPGSGAGAAAGGPAVTRQGSRAGGPAAPGAPCWLLLDGAAVGAEALSQPVDPGPGGTLARCLDAGAALWALAAAGIARDGARALRRAARLNRHGGSPFSGAQPVAFGITEVEIEAELAWTAVAAHLAATETAAAPAAQPAMGAADPADPAGASERPVAARPAAPGAEPELEAGQGLVLATAAARALAAVAAQTAALGGSWGLAVDGPLAGGDAAVLTAFFGGARMLERELGRALGIADDSNGAGGAAGAGEAAAEGGA